MSKHYIIPIFVPHKGCPHDCVFCNQKRITGTNKDITAIDVRSIIDEYLDTINAKGEEAFVEVSFFGGSFTAIPIDYQIELLSEAYKAKLSGKVKAIRLSTRPDYINEFILDNLRNYNVDIIELGVQSMKDDVLIASERGHTAEDVRISSILIKNYGFSLGLQMMTGLPEDTIEKDIFTANEIIKLKPDFVRIYPALTIKDTYMEDMYRDGLYKPQSVDEAVAVCKELYRLYTNSSIPIIRLGLQPTETITVGKDVVAGPFHPAFRELVEGSLMNDMVNFLLHNYFGDETDIKLYINPCGLSKLFTDKKRYFITLKEKYPFKKIVVIQSSMMDYGLIEVIGHKTVKKLSLYEYLKLEK